MYRALLICIGLFGAILIQGQNLLDNEGRKTGHWKVDYSNGLTRYEGNFEKGRPVGELLRYYENGAIQARMDSEERKQGEEGK
jgi:antitoxin component YwqK of YwqJK toxin-antitoxin module